MSFNTLALLAVVVFVTIGGVLWYYVSKTRHLERALKLALVKRQVSYDKSDGAQRATIKGQVAEQMAPLLPGFPFHTSDFRFLGQPIDFIVYAGLTEAKEGLGGISEIVLGDIKMGGATLSPHQRMIKQAVEQGRVRWQTLYVDQDFRITERRAK